MLTRTVDRILIDHFKISKTALLIEGARQIGKTFSIRQFGKKFKTYIEINFIEQPEAISLFKDLSNTKDLLARLSLFTKQKLIKHKKRYPYLF